MGMIRDDELTMKPYGLGLTEKLLFFISGILASIPLALFVSTFTDQPCVELPMFCASLCSIVILAPFVEECAKACPLFYRHGETKDRFSLWGFWLVWDLASLYFYYTYWLWALPYL